MRPPPAHHSGRRAYGRSSLEARSDRAWSNRVAARSTGRAVSAGIAYFVIAFSAGFALGTFRVLVLVPQLSSPRAETVAVLIELPIILAISWVVCRRLIARMTVAEAATDRLVMGGIALALLLIAEVSLGALGFGRSLWEQISRYRMLPDLLGLMGQLAFAAIPCIQLQMSNRKRLRPAASANAGEPDDRG